MFNILRGMHPAEATRGVSPDTTLPTATAIIDDNWALSAQKLVDGEPNPDAKPMRKLSDAEIANLFENNGSSLC